MSRNIRKDAIKLLDARIKTHTLAQACIENKNGRQLFVEVVKACVGIKEIPPNEGVEVELFQKTVSLSPGDAWCMAFLQTCLAYVEKTIGVVSPVHASGGCVDVWNNTPTSQRVKIQPLAGAIAIWQHTRDPVHGHTGMVLDCDGVTFHAIEGNTADGEDNLNGIVGQTGQGVRLTHRRYDTFNPHNGDMLLLGSLKPF